MYNNGQNNVTIEIVSQLQALTDRIKRLENQLEGHQVVTVAADPINLIEGQIWTNSTSHVTKVYLNGVVRTINVT